MEYKIDKITTKFDKDNNLDLKWKPKSTCIGAAYRKCWNGPKIDEATGIVSDLTSVCRF